MTARDKWVKQQKNIYIIKLEKAQRAANKAKDYRLVWVLESKIKRLENETKI